ncbi:MAG: hypothetical protein C4336_08580 [Armatimonadota bacterium]
MVGDVRGHLWREPLVVYGGVLEGVYAGRHRRWVCLVRADGSLVPTPSELAEQERLRAEQERQRAEKLAERLRALGVDPESIE